MNLTVQEYPVGTGQSVLRNYDGKFVFFLQELLSEYHGDEKPGIYDLNTAMTADEMIAIMAHEGEEEGEAE